jgi:4-alpha-glucanotransferase
MKVLQFAFEPDADSAYLPHNHISNCVVYTGTHDNNTLAGWISEMSEQRPDVIKYACDYLGVNDISMLREAVIRAALGSVANTAIIQMQDWLALGAEARINTPGTTGPHNWTFRLTGDVLTAELAQKIRGMTENNL